MVKYTDLKIYQNSNENKECWVKIRKGEFSQMSRNILGDISNNCSYIRFDVVYHWFNGKREMNDKKGFDHIEDAEKFYQKKIKDVNKKIA